MCGMCPLPRHVLDAMAIRGPGAESDGAREAARVRGCVRPRSLTIEGRLSMNMASPGTAGGRETLIVVALGPLEGYMSRVGTVHR